ncbi:GNAT family N-acetyltransferase [Paucisalibacillus sp. EB02]|uniref:GNAT family N-acetyltransferase n=1 Tax=Paucisalibacillus sp. EB02 TaxID=1347087 RepID=UPI0004B25412|nr:GNAT family N-acetyltransferase [Paucisalibacillus sp. EB02]
MEIRHLTVTEMEAAIRLSDKTFRNEKHVSMGKAFPFVFSRDANVSFGAFEQDKLVCFFGLVPFRLKIGASYVNAYSIGSVCTDPVYRGKGIASDVLAEIYDFIDRSGGALLLVSGDRGLYTRKGCFAVGESYSYSMTEVKPIIHEGTIRKGTAIDLMRVFSLAQQKEVRYESSINEWKTLLNTGGYASIFYLKQSIIISEKQGVIDGYVVAGLPDETNSSRTALILEWGGEPRTVLAILMSLLGEDGVDTVKIKVPWHDEMNVSLVEYSKEAESIGGTIRVINPERMLEQLMPYLQSKDPAIYNKLQIKGQGDGKIDLQYDGQRWILTVEEFSNLLFNTPGNLIPSLFPIPLPSTEGIHYV